MDIRDLRTLEQLRAPAASLQAIPVRRGLARHHQPAATAHLHQTVTSFYLNLREKSELAVLMRSNKGGLRMRPLSNRPDWSLRRRTKDSGAVDRTYLCGIIASLGTYISGAALFNNLNNR